MKIINNRIIYAFVMLFFTSYSLADCTDTIMDPGKDTKIKYHTNSYNIWKFSCEKQSGTRHQSLPKTEGKSCAEPRIDGCSFHESNILFTKRDQLLMKAACNRHDLCYSTYGTTKLTCDTEFSKNLKYAEDEFSGTYSVAAVTAAVFILGDHEAGQKWGEDNNCKL